MAAGVGDECSVVPSREHALLRFTSNLCDIKHLMKLKLNLRHCVGNRRTAERGNRGGAP